MNAARLSTIVRQEESWARDAVSAISRGDGVAALHAFAERGCVSVSPTVEDACHNLISDWGKHGSIDPERHVILANEKSQALLLNALAQARRLLDGNLIGSPLWINETPFYEGDRILFGRNSRHLHVQNGLMGSITEISGQLLSVRLDSGRTVTFHSMHYPHFGLGYAATTHKAQGITADHVYALVGGSMQCQELSYVQISRGRKSTRLFVEHQNAGKELSTLEKAMNEQRPKTLAVSVCELAPKREISMCPR